jgi:hypothetical protein
MPISACVKIALLTIALSCSAALIAQQPENPPTPPPAPPAKQPGPPCVSPTQAAQNPNREVCVAAHVYDIVELADGTRFLDICPANLADDQCRFTLLTMAWDREDVGDLRRYRDQDVRVRGIVRITHGRMGIVISHVRQFSGGPEKFRPNPKLLSGFNAQSDRMPVRDPNLAASGHHRSFMNTADKIPTRPKP